MSNFHRIYLPNEYYFFTQVTYKRKPILTSLTAINRLRQAFKKTMTKHPFEIISIVILPDHLHCIWKMPENDADFTIRWRKIKHYFSTGINAEKNARGEKEVWQAKFWDHILRNQQDFNIHRDYINYNPVKHGYVSSPNEWPYSSFLKDVKNGYYDLKWGGESLMNKMNFE